VLGTLLFSGLFVLSFVNHLTNPEPLIGLTEKALSGAAGQPVGHDVAMLAYWASSGLLVGAPLLVLGLLSDVVRKLGAFLLLVFLIGVTFTVHGFWQFEGAERDQHLPHFLKNVSLIGALLLILAERGGSRAKPSAKASRAPKKSTDTPKKVN